MISTKQRLSFTNKEYTVTPRQFKEIQERNKIYEKLSYKRKLNLSTERLNYEVCLEGKYQSSIILNDYYYGQHIPSMHTCNKCGLNWYARPNSIRPSTAITPCPKCYKHKIQLTSETYSSKLKSINSKIECLGTYTNQYDKIEHKCIKCDNRWLVRPKDLIFKKSGCPICYLINRKLRNEKFIVVDNKTFKVEGYEPYAINYLINKGYKVSEISSDKQIIIKYYDNTINKIRKHIPDLYISNINTLIEVKSTYTFIITKQAFKLTKMKYKEAIKQGYNYQIMVFGDRGRLVVLPKFWLLFSYESMKIWMKGKRNVRGY